MIHKSGFYWPGCTQPSIPLGSAQMSRGELLLWGSQLRTFTKGLKRIGTNQGVATSQLGGTHIHATHACSSFGSSVGRLGGQVCQGQLNLPSFRGRYINRGGNLRFTRGNSWALPKALNLEAITAGQGGYYGGILVMVITAVHKSSVSPMGGHTAATKLLQ